MALITLHVAHGMPADGRCEATAGELSRMIWGDDRERAGSNTRKLLRALFDLRQAQFTVPGYDMINQRPAPAVSDTSLLINLAVDEMMLKAFSERGGIGLTASTSARLSVANGGERLAGACTPITRSVWLSPTFDDSTGPRRSSCAASSPRVPYRQVFEGPDDVEIVEVPLTLEHCHALGMRNAADAGRRRTLNEAGQRVCAADKSFVAFEAHGGRGCDSFLRIARRRPRRSPLEPPVVVAAEQLTLAA
jgi:hypothetical protein